MLADKYYGPLAKQYDLARCHSLRWAKEQLSIAEYVTSGPVLDVPLGTGRYCEIYRDKGLKVFGVDLSRDMIAEAKARYPEIDARQGSVFDLPFSDNAFPVVVCTRLLDWFSPDDLRRAVKELRRVAYQLVVSIRHGVKEVRVNQTHDLSEFYQAIDGLFIAGRKHTETTRDGYEEIFSLRPPVWSDVIRQFEHHGHTPAFELQRLGLEWFKDVGDSEADFDISAEYWTGPELFAVVKEMARQNPSYITDEAPRFAGETPVLLRKGKEVVVLDGRRRINAAKDDPARVPVLVLTCK